MTQKRVHFRRSTPQQRRYLFEIWQETGSIHEACRRAHVSIRTFYFWKPRFEEGGYAALETVRSHAPKNPRRIPPDIAAQIIELKQTRPDWGKLRIAKEVTRQNEAISSISPNTVRRVLVEADLWRRPQTPGSS